MLHQFGDISLVIQLKRLVPDAQQLSDFKALLFITADTG